MLKTYRKRKQKFRVRAIKIIYAFCYFIFVLAHDLLAQLPHTDQVQQETQDSWKKELQERPQVENFEDLSPEAKQWILEKKRKVEERAVQSYELDELDSFFDPKVDYSLFFGRVTDRDQAQQILKIFSETKNIRFFRIGDAVRFSIHESKDDYQCNANVRGIENQYLILYVKSIQVCWKDDTPIRRGTQINLVSEVLLKRMIQASEYRRVLMQQKQDFLKQLNEVNHYVWSFDQKRVLLAGEFDKQILDIQKEKQQAMEQLLGQKEEKIVLQKELMQKLEELDSSLDFYRPDRQEYFADRWRMDQHMGLPVGNRPRPLILKADLEKHFEQNFFSY